MGMPPADKEIAVLGVVPATTKMIDDFIMYRADVNSLFSIPPVEIGEHFSEPLLQMYSAMSKADSELDVYLTLISSSTDELRKMLVENHSGFFIRRVGKYFEIFSDEFNKLLTSHPFQESAVRVVETIKGSFCAALDTYTSSLKDELDRYKRIIDSNGKLTVSNITDIIAALKNLVDCYLDGVGFALAQLVHVK